MKTYMTILDVKENNSIARRISDCSIVTIKQTETNIFLNELKDIKPLLDSNLIDYSSTKDFKIDTEYPKGSIVRFKGRYKVAIEDVIGVTPANIAKWDDAPMFEKDCLNNIWCTYIAPYISHNVVLNDPPLINELTTGTYVSASLIKHYELKLIKAAESAYENMRTMLLENECLGIVLEKRCIKPEKNNNQEQNTTGIMFY